MYTQSVDSAAGFTSKAVTTRDTYGRKLSAQTLALSNYDTVSYSYDSSGHLHTVSAPCNTTLGATCPTAAQTYTDDGTGRVKTDTMISGVGTPAVVTNTYPNGDVLTILSPTPGVEANKQVQTEYDGLGRTVSVCRGTSALPGSSSCGQRSTTASGYLTKYTLDALGRISQTQQNAMASNAQTYSSQFDMLSRATQTTSPMAGTNNLYYDSTTTDCSESPAAKGKLVETVDYDGNKKCYSYESNGGRVSAITTVSRRY